MPPVCLKFLDLLLQLFSILFDQDPHQRVLEQLGKVNFAEFLVCASLLWSPSRPRNPALPCEEMSFSFCVLNFEFEPLRRSFHSLVTWRSDSGPGMGLQASSTGTTALLGHSTYVWVSPPMCTPESCCPSCGEDQQILQVVSELVGLHAESGELVSFLLFFCFLVLCVLSARASVFQTHHDSSAPPSVLLLCGPLVSLWVYAFFGGHDE